MWLMKNLSINRSKGVQADKGAVASSQGSRVDVKTSQEHIGIPIAAPYGIAYIPPGGEDTVVMPINGGAVCVGTVMKSSNLEPGEIKLFSKGGAELVLKNDGTILANGVDITKGGE
ncbi:MAG: hypothetical protein ACI4I4_04475 [Acutalibacteraceae bacterium]